MASAFTTSTSTTAAIANLYAPIPQDIKIWFFDVCGRTELILLTDNIQMNVMRHVRCGRNLKQMWITKKKKKRKRKRECRKCVRINKCLENLYSDSVNDTYYTYITGTPPFSILVGSSSMQNEWCVIQFCTVLPILMKLISFGFIIVGERAHIHNVCWNVRAWAILCSFERKNITVCCLW